MNVQTTSVFDHVTLVVPRIRIWTGAATINREKVFEGASKMPPKKLITDGEIHLVARSRIAPLINQRAAVERKLEPYGAKFLGGHIVPNDKVDQCLSEMKDIEAQFNDELNKLTSDLDMAYAEQEKEFPEWAQIMRLHQISHGQVSGRCRFEIAVLRIAQPVSPKAADAFDNSQDSVIAAVLVSLARNAKATQKLMIGRDVIGQKLLNNVRDHVEKLHGFRFANPQVLPVANALRESLAKLPKKGDLDMVQTQLVAGIIAQLSDPETILQHGAAVMSGFVAAQQPEESVDLLSPISTSNEDDKPAPIHHANPLPMPPPQVPAQTRQALVW